MLKKLFLLTLALMLFTCTALADYQSDYYIPPVANEGQYPVVSDGSVSLSYWMSINASAVSWIANNDENSAWKKFQEVTGVDLKFIHPAVGTEAESFKIMVASGDLPDLIQCSYGTYTGGLPQMYTDGLIVDLKPYLEEYAPQYWEVINHDPDTFRYVQDDDKILGFYRITYDDANPWTRANLRQDWLDEFGMESPVTIADYEAYFDAILANKPGVTPLTINLENAETLMPFTSAFDLLKAFYVEDGVVKNYYNADQLYDFVSLMNKWFQKGYISKDFASLTDTEVMALFDGGMLGMYVGSCDNCAIRTANMDIEVTNARYMRKEADSVVKTEIFVTPATQSWLTVVTTACKDIPAAVAAMNYAYTKEGAETFTFGIEGEHFNYDPVTGIPTFTEFMTNNPNGMTISNVSYVYKCHISSRYSFPDTIGIPTLKSADGTTIDARGLWRGENDPLVNASLRLPAMKLTAAESQERADVMAEVGTYGQEMIYKFVVGTESLDKFEAFQKEIMDMGLRRGLEITQGAYDRFIAIK